MKKKIARGSMLAVAALSLMIGGNSYTFSVKDQVKETPVIISKAIENNASDVKAFTKGNIVETTEEKVVAEEPTVKEKKNKKAKKSKAKESKEKKTVIAEEVTTEITAQAAPVEDVDLEHKEAKIESNQIVANIDSYLNIRAEATEDSDVIGKFYSGNVGTIVEKGDEWSVVASGNAYGYVKNDYLLFGEAAEDYIEANCDQVAKVTAETLNIREEESTESDIIHLSGEGEALQILGQDDGWFKVAVDENVGYVSSDYVYVDYVYETAVTIEEENAAIAAAEAEAQAQATEQAQVQAPTTQAPATQAPTTQAPKQEKPTQKPANVDKKPASTGSLGQDIANYAVQFVGNPYVYGGTSLTNGADCSGFVQSVYKKFGYSLSRVASSQANDGRSVGVKNIQPGDLVFYHGFGHVAIYIGGGRVVHASNAQTGIKISNYNYSRIDRVVRIIK